MEVQVEAQVGELVEALGLVRAQLRVPVAAVAVVQVAAVAGAVGPARPSYAV